MAAGLEAVRHAQNVLDALSRDENYGWTSEQGFVVGVPDNNSEQYYPRYSSGRIARELARVRRGDHDGETFAFWISQALHYGIKPSLDQERIQRDFVHKLSLDNGRLTVPTKLLSLSQRIQDQVQSASFETEIKQEEEDGEILVQKDHEPATENSNSDPQRRRQDTSSGPLPALQNRSARDDDGDVERGNRQSLDLAAPSPKSVPQASSPAPTHTCQDRSFIQHSGGKATTPNSTLADRTRFPQPHQTPFEIVIPLQFSDVDSYATASSPIPTSVPEHAGQQHKNSPRRRRTCQALDHPQPGRASALGNLKMGAGLSQETSDADDANTSPQLAERSSATQEETSEVHQGEDDAISQQVFSLYLANLNNGRAQGQKTASMHAFTPLRSQGTFQQPNPRSNGMRQLPRSKSSSKKDSSVPSVAETDAPADDDEEQAQPQEALKVSAQAARVDSQPPAENKSRGGRSWQDYLQEHPHLQPCSVPFYPHGWRPNLAKYLEMPYILQEIRSRLGRGLYDDTAIQFCIELADGDPDLAYWNFVDAAGIKDVDHRPMSAYKIRFPGYKCTETHVSLGRIGTATHQNSPISPTPSDELDLSGQTLVPSSQTIERHHGKPDSNDTVSYAPTDTSRPSLIAMAKNPRRWTPLDQMDKGVLYRAESTDRGFYVRTHTSRVQHKFPMNALQSAWKKIEEEEKFMKGLGINVVSRVGYDRRAPHRKDPRQYVLGHVQRAPQVLPRSLSHGNVSIDGHTNIPWQIQAMKDSSNQLTHAQKLTEQAAGPGPMELDEPSTSQSPECHDQVDSRSQPTTETILAQDLSNGKRKRAAPEASRTNGIDSSMATFRESVKKRKSARETGVQRSSAPLDGRLNGSAAATQAPSGATAGRGPVLPTAGDNINGGIESLPSRGPDSREKWECDWEGCACKYGTIKELYDHVRVVHVGYEELGNLNLQCHWGECRSELSYQSTAVGHILTHVPYAPHVCDRCGQAYKTRVKLRDHVCQPSDTHNNDFNSFNDVQAPSAPLPEGLEEAQLSSSVSKQHVQMDRSDDHGAVVQRQDPPRSQSSREDGDATPVSPVQGDSTPSNHNDGHRNAREDSGTTRQPSRAAEPLPSTKVQFPIKLLPEKGNGFDFYEIDEEATLTQYETAVSSLPNGGPKHMRKRHKMWRKVVDGIRAGTTESSAEAQLRLGREQRNTLKATLQETSNDDDAEDLRTNLERIRTKVTKARKVVSDKWDE